MGSDLNQTANFTANESGLEKNFLVERITDTSSNVGELALGLIGTGVIYKIETSRLPRKVVYAVEVIWMTGHVLAVISNHHRDSGGYTLIIFPPVKIAF